MNSLTKDNGDKARSPIQNEKNGNAVKDEIKTAPSPKKIEHSLGTDQVNKPLAEKDSNHVGPKLNQTPISYEYIIESADAKFLKVEEGIFKFNSNRVGIPLPAGKYHFDLLDEEKKTIYGEISVTLKAKKQKIIFNGQYYETKDLK